MSKRKEFIAVYKLFFKDPDEVDALMTAEYVRQKIEEILEKGDWIDTVQVIGTDSQVQPADMVILLRKTRNALIRTKLRDCFDTARQLDQFAWQFSNLCEHPGEDGPSYDHGRFMPIAERVLSGEEVLE